MTRKLKKNVRRPTDTKIKINFSNGVKSTWNLKPDMLEIYFYWHKEKTGELENTYRKSFSCPGNTDRTKW